MNPVSILRQKQQQFQVALQQMLPQWQRSDFDSKNLRCVACHSQDVQTKPGISKRRAYLCRRCKTIFYEPLDPHCDCPEPGKSSKCLQCLSYQQLMQMVSEYLKAQQ